MFATRISNVRVGALARAACWLRKIVFLAGGLGLLSGHILGAEIASAKEHQLKAAFIYNFLKFVEWPTNRLQETNTPIIIGVTGGSPIGPALEAVVKDRRLNGRELIVRVVDSPEAAKATHLLFVAGSEDLRLDGLLLALARNGTLTVGESESFANHGGMIRFKLEEEKLRFDINMDAVELDGLKISAQLQKLAKSVRRKSGA